MELEMTLWVFAGIFVGIGIVMVFFSRDSDRSFKIFCRIFSILPFGVAVYFILTALHIVKVFIFLRH